MAVQVRAPCKPSKRNQENNQRVTFGGEILSLRSVEHVILEEEEEGCDDDVGGEEDEIEGGVVNNGHVNGNDNGNGNGNVSSTRSSQRSSTRSNSSSRRIDSPPPPSVSERSTSPSLPRKVRKESDGKKSGTVVNIFNKKQQAGKSTMSTPNLLTLAANNNINDNESSSSSSFEEFNINIDIDTKVTAIVGGSLRGGASTDPTPSPISKMKRSKSELILLSPEFRTNLMQEQNERDPLFYYEVKRTIGTGSMGSVALVKKRHAAVGGSARKKVRETIQSHKRKQECFKLPFGIGGIFKFCIGDNELRPVTATSTAPSTPKSNNKGRRGGGNNTNSSLKETLLSTVDTWISSSGILSSGISAISTTTTTTTSDRLRQYSSSKSNSSILFPDDVNTPMILEEPDDDDDDDVDTLDNLYDDNSDSDNDGSKRTTSSVSDYEYAMKSIHLSRVTDDCFVQELKNEIKILKKLDHPHIVRPIETYQFKNQIFIIMEVCSGGDLYSRDPYTEEEAARIISSVLSAVSYLHSNNVAHRDLKYENILFVNESPKAEIKLIDFGLSKIYGNVIGTNGRSATLTEGVGTIYTMAPEVLKGSYTKQADVWSVGVIAYMLLSSQMPFYGRKRQHIVEQILGGKYDFRGRRWRKIGEPAKDFVRDLLVIDPDERLDAERASSCVWLNKRFAATVRGPREKEIRSARKSMTRYAGYTKLKKMALMVVAHRSTCEEIGILRKVFQKYASNSNNGCISYEEFRDAWKESGLPPEDTKSVFDAVDLDGSGRIRYTEFLAATIEAQGEISEERLAEAFDRFDSDDSGYISVDNLSEILGKDFPRDEIQDIIGDAGETDENPINEGDHWKTSRISYSAFLALWEKNNEKEVRANKLRMLGSQANLSALAAVDDDDNDTIASTSTLECQETAIARATFLMDKHGTTNNNAGGGRVSSNSSNINTKTASSFSSSKKQVGFEDTMVAISANNHVEQKIVDDPDDYDIGGGIVI